MLVDKGENLLLSLVPRLVRTCHRCGRRLILFWKTKKIIEDERTLSDVASQKGKSKKEHVDEKVFIELDVRGFVSDLCTWNLCFLSSIYSTFHYC